MAGLADCSPRNSSTVAAYLEAALGLSSAPRREKQRNCVGTHVAVAWFRRGTPRRAVTCAVWVRLCGLRKGEKTHAGCAAGRGHAGQPGANRRPRRRKLYLHHRGRNCRTRATEIRGFGPRWSFLLMGRRRRGVPYENRRSTPCESASRRRPTQRSCERFHLPPGQARPARSACPRWPCITRSDALSETA